MKVARTFGILILGLSGCRARTDTAGPLGVDPWASCPRTAVIEDGEDNDHQVIRHGQRNGYMYTFADDRGTTVTPTAGAKGGTFAMSPGGANGSMYAARIHGRVGEGEVVFAGFGINFSDPKRPYDATPHTGVSFFARRGPGGVGGLRLKVPDRNTDPEGGICEECFNDFGIDLELQEEWTYYTVRFDRLEQMAGWGRPRPAAVDPSALYGLQWQVSASGAAFDVWIDDVAFMGCS